MTSRTSGSSGGLNPSNSQNQSSMPGEMVRKLMRSVSKRKYSLSTRPVSRCDSVISNGSGGGEGSQRKISRYGNNASSRSLRKISRGYSPNHQKKSLSSMGESMDSGKHNQIDQTARVHFGMTVSFSGYFNRRSVILNLDVFRDTHKSFNQTGSC